jgi:hypothetical protein
VQVPARLGRLVLGLLLCKTYDRRRRSQCHPFPAQRRTEFREPASDYMMGTVVALPRKL